MQVCCMIVRKLHARAGCEHEEPHKRHVEGSAAMGIAVASISYSLCLIPPITPCLEQPIT
jgi:hypothetical protein